MKKQIFIITASLVIIGLFSLPGLASRREHREHEEHDRHQRHDYDDGHYVRGDDDRYEEDEHTDHSRQQEHEHGHRSNRDGYNSFYKNSRISAVGIREMVSASLDKWKAGEGWEKRKKGSIELIVPIQYRDQTVGKIKVNPTSGEIMPEDAKHTGKQVKVSLDQARKTVDKALAKMRVGDDIRMGKHGFIWKVPLVVDGMVVEEIKVAGNGGILPDAHMEEETRYRHRKPPTHKGPSFY